MRCAAWDLQSNDTNNLENALHKKHCMRILLMVSLISLSLRSHAASPKVYAVVVGVSVYKDSNIPALKFADKDALAFADFLKTANAGAVPSENMVVLINEKATRSNVFRELVQLFSRSGKDDLIVFYFAGHGKNDVMENSGYLLTYDTENENEAGTAISMEEIKSKIDHSRAKMKVAYIDACHAGMFKSYGTRGSSNDNAEIIKAYTAGLSNASEGNVAFLACAARQESREDEKLGHGYFTYYLIRGMKGDADKEQKGAAAFDDGVVTIGEMKTYLTRQIEQATTFKQRPTIEGIYDDDFPLSILRSNLSLSAEIAKQPARPAVQPAVNTVQPKEAPAQSSINTAAVADLNLTGTWKLRINSTKMIKSTGTVASNFVGGGTLELVQTGKNITGKYTSYSPSFRTGDVTGSVTADGINLTIASTYGGCMGNAVMTVNGKPSQGSIIGTVGTEGALEGKCIIGTGPSIMTKF